MVLRGYGEGSSDSLDATRPAIRPTGYRNSATFRRMPRARTASPLASYLARSAHHALPLNPPVMPPDLSRTPVPSRHTQHASRRPSSMPPADLPRPRHLFSKLLERGQVLVTLQDDPLHRSAGDYVLEQVPDLWR